MSYILVVDDEKDIRDLISQILFDVVSCCCPTLEVELALNAQRLEEVANGRLSSLCFM